MVNAIKRAGGVEAVVERLGLARTNSKHLRTLGRPGAFSARAGAYAAVQGRPPRAGAGVMWTTKEWVRAGRVDLKHAIERDGGFEPVAERVGMVAG